MLVCVTVGTLSLLTKVIVIVLGALFKTAFPPFAFKTKSIVIVSSVSTKPSLKTLTVKLRDAVEPVGKVTVGLTIV